MKIVSTIANLFSMTVLLVLCFCTTVSAASRIQNRQASDLHAVRRSLRRLDESLLNGHIERIQIFYLPPLTETLFGFKPGVIDTAYKYKLDIVLSHGYSVETRSLHRAISHATVSKTIFGFYDFRWGCKLYDRKTKNVYIIYLDRWGQNVVIDGKSASLSKNFYLWLQSQFTYRSE